MTHVQVGLAMTLVIMLENVNNNMISDRYEKNIIKSIDSNIMLLDSMGTEWR